ncbi:MAG: 2'-5' RNA ligase family protein, partial [Clostridia bacterium]|nr:2'-5' RNA ligase family protein [Clostridia bacterium]
SAMDCIDAKPFSLYINGFGRFRRTGGDIYWRGIKPNKELEKIYGQLTKALIDRGFAIDVRPFKPHLTLGRQVVVKDGFDRYDFEKNLPKLRADVNRISLMKSERINGRLTYTEIYGIDL